MWSEILYWLGCIILTLAGPMTLMSITGFHDVNHQFLLIGVREDECPSSSPTPQTTSSP